MSNRKRNEWDRYVDDKALLRVGGGITQFIDGYESYIWRDFETHCIFINVYLKENQWIPKNILKELQEVIYNKILKIEWSKYEGCFIHFNSASMQDFIPTYEGLGLNKKKTYKDLKFMKQELLKVIKFLKEKGIK